MKLVRWLLACLSRRRPQQPSESPEAYVARIVKEEQARRFGS